MSLYVRLFCNFFSHRKTARLKGSLGKDALWLPPRLWAYAAENQPDGDFSDYDAPELAALLGYDGDASSMLQALLKAGFMDPDPLRIHDWKAHNGYHETYAIRASKAANARWSGAVKRSEKEKTGHEMKGQETSIASSMPEEVVLWNSISSLPKIRSVSNSRLRSLKARRKDSFWRENYKTAIERIPMCAFLMGNNPRNWIADFDWILKPDSVAKIIEGKYDRSPNADSPRSDLAQRISLEKLIKHAEKEIADLKEQNRSESDSAKVEARRTDMKRLETNIAGWRKALLELDPS